MWYDALKEMKRQSGKTTAQIAKESGIPEPTLEKLFAGATKDPKFPTLQKLVHYFGKTLNDLERDCEEGKKNEPTTLSDSELDNNLYNLLGQLKPTDLEKVAAFVQGLLANS